MTDTTRIPADRRKATGARRLVGLALVALSPALVACGSRGVFSGAPYTGDIQPQTVPRVEPTDPPAGAGAGAPATRAAPVEDVQEEAIDPPDDFDVTVEPPEEISEPLPTDPESPAEEAAPPIAPQSNATSSPPQPTVAAVSVEVPAEASPPRPPSPSSFPNLADVPERPSDLPTTEERARILAELQADQAEGLSATEDAAE